MGKLYTFTARDSTGKKINGQMEAQSSSGVIRSLHENGFFAIKVEEAVNEGTLFQRKISLRELTFLCKQLAALLKSGVPIIKAMHSVIEQVKNKKLRSILDGVIKDLENGATVYHAFHKHHYYFPSIFANLLYAAEANGQLDNVFTLLAQHFQKEHQIRKKIMNAISYPAFILLFAIIMVTGIITFALPTFIDMFESSGMSLPFITKMLLVIHSISKRYGWFLLLILGAGAITVIYIFHTEKGRNYLDSIFLRLPIIAGIIKKQGLFRFSQSLHDLYASGVSIEKSLQIVAEIVPNHVLRHEILEARQQVINGKSIAESFRQSKFIPTNALAMIKIGEESGELETLLKDVALMSKEEFEQKANELTTFIEPLLLILVGLFVGLVILGTLLPIYNGMFQF